VKQEMTPEEIAKKEVVYSIPGMDEVKVTREVEYRATDEGSLAADIYYPPDAQSGARLPAIVFVAGYPDAGFEKMLGCKFKEMGAYLSWARLTAASGLVAITYANREPAADVQALLQHVRQNAAALGIDEQRVGLWACSGNVPLALSILMNDASLKCAVLCYGLMLDLEGAAHVAEAAKTWGFANPCAGKSIADLPRDVPLFIARAGRDQTPHLNETIDGFVAAALAQNLPVTFVNHPAAPHAFDLFDDGEASREIVRRVLAFMRFHLLAAA
jgi:dienelactone hydrolase